MQIACPQCSMQYDLDPRLLPPAGASVQCTRCGFVFTATPSGEVLVPGPAQNPSRTPVGTRTSVFGSPHAGASKHGAPNTQTTQIFGVVPPPSAPAPGASTAGSHLPPGSKTQVFAAPGAPAPSATTTQVFGAAAVAAKASPAPTTQVFGAASVPPQPPPGTTTQVFGAAAVAAKASLATTTQVFGAPSASSQPSPATTTQVFGAPDVAEKAPSPTTTQVFGAPAGVGKPPSAATTQTFGAAEVHAARKAMQGAAPASGADGGSASWLAEPTSGASRPRTVTSPAGVPLSVESVELPEEPVPLPAPAHEFHPPEPEIARSGPIAVSRRAPSVELPPELIVPDRPASAKPEREESSGGGRERIFIVLAALVALGLTAWLSYPVWRNQGSELPVEAMAAKDAAMSLMRRDDAASREQAIQSLTDLVGRFPKFTEAQAELVVALALQLDDVRVDLDLARQEEARIQKEISQLEMSKATADWSGRVTAHQQELATIGEQKRSFDAAAANLSKQLEQSLSVIRMAPETEPSSDVVARVKAQAISEAVNGTPQAVALAERLKKVEGNTHWSVLALAEFGLNANTPPAALPEVAEQLAQVRAKDQTFFRAYVLGARLALRQKDPATAQELLDAVLALNPNHALARKLQKWAASTAPKP